MAAALEKVGIPYYVLEQRGELSQEGAAIALWRNALTALDAVGESAILCPLKPARNMPSIVITHRTLYPYDRVSQTVLDIAVIRSISPRDPERSTRGRFS